MLTDSNSCTFCSIAATATAAYLGGGTNGVRKISNILGTPTVATVAGAGVPTSFARADRRSHTAVAVLHRGSGAGPSTIYVTTDEATWVPLAGPPGVNGGCWPIGWK